MAALPAANTRLNTRVAMICCTRRTMRITGGGPVTPDMKQDGNPAVQCMWRVSLCPHLFVSAVILLSMTFVSAPRRLKLAFRLSQ